MTQKWRFMACWANFFAGQPEKSGAGRTFSRVGPRSRVLGELFRGIPVGGGVLGEFRTGIARRGRERGQFCTGSGSACGIKFSLLGLLVAKAVKGSPCARKVGRNQRFGACRESFVPGGPPSRAAGRVLYRVGRRAGRQGEFCTGWAAEPGGRESFVPGGPPSRAAGRVLYRLIPSSRAAGRVLSR